MTILHTYIDHRPRWTSIDFVKSSKVKVIFWLLTFYCFRTRPHFGIHWWYFTHVLTMTRGGPLLIWGQKIKVIIGLWTFYRFRIKTPFSFCMDENSISFRHTYWLTMNGGGPLLILRSKEQRWMSYLDLQLFVSHGRPILILGSGS